MKRHVNDNKRVIKLYLWTIFCIVLCANACSDGREQLDSTSDSETLQPEPSLTEGNYTLASTTTLLDSAIEKAISVEEERVDGTTVLCYSAGQTPPVVGEVLLSGGNGIASPFPNGFMGKVTAVTKKDNTYLVTTVPAALTEAFTKLNVDTLFNLLPQSTESRAISFETTEDDEGFQNFTIEVSESENGVVELEGYITLGLRLLCVVDLQNQIRNATFTLDSKLKADYTVSLSEELEQELKVPIGSPISLGAYSVPNTPFRITPELQLYLYVTAKGEASFSLGMTYERGMSSFVRLRQGNWENGIRFREGKSDGRFMTASELSLKGECVEGVSMALDCKINHSSMVAVGLETSVGCKQTGEFDVYQRGYIGELIEETGRVRVYDDDLMNASINCSLVAELQATASASFFGLNYEGSYPIPGCSFETEPIQLHLFPDMGTPQCSLDWEKQTVTIEVPYSPTELLSSETSLEIHLYEGSGNPACISDFPVAVSNKKNLSSSDSTSFTFTFSDLDGKYSVYPVIRSPIVANSNKETYPIYNTTKAPIAFEISGDRAMLMKLYRDNGGDQWKHQDNWGSDLPLSEWYGVTTSEGQVIKIDLKDNGVIGKVDLRGGLTQLRSLDLRYNAITEVNVSGLGGLVSVDVYCPSMKYLDVSNCNKLTHVGISSPKYSIEQPSYCELDSLNISNTAIKAIGEIIYLHLKSFKAVGCTELTSLRFVGGNEQCPTGENPFPTEIGKIICHDNPKLDLISLRFFGQIHTLDIRDCENLMEIFIRNCPFIPETDPHISNLVIKNCENLKWLSIYGTVDNRDT